MRTLVAKAGLLLCCLASGIMLAWPAAAQTAVPAQALYGTWYTYPLGNPNTDSIRHEFRHNAGSGKDEMIVSRICQGDYRAVIARAISPIEVSENTIRIAKTVTDSEKGEMNSVCQVSIEAGVLTYSVSSDGNRISLTNPGGTPDMFDLARQDASSEAVLAPSLFGTWSFPPLADHGATVQVKLVFYTTGDSERGTVRQITSCSKTTTTLMSQVDSAIRVGKDEITILQTVSHDQQDGPFSCKATIRAGTLHFAISANGATMTLTAAGDKPLVLTRDTSPAEN